MSPKIFQVRDTEAANLTVIDAPGVLVLIDVMTSNEASRQSMQLIREHVSDKPVIAVIYTHSHVDHFGGVEGVIDAADVHAGTVRIFAPGHDFERRMMSEWVVARNAGGRRGVLSYSQHLDPGPQGVVSCGISIGTVGPGRTMSYLPPTDLITRTGAVHEIGGMEFHFLYEPDTEAQKRCTFGSQNLGP